MAMQRENNTPGELAAHWRMARLADKNIRI